MSLFINTLERLPLIGMITSIFTATITTNDLLQISAIVLGLFIAIITLITKTLELIDRYHINQEHKKNNKNKTKKPILKI